MFVHSPAAAGVPALPGVARLLATGAAAAGADGVQQQAQQHQQSSHQHCGMVGEEQRLWRKNGELLLTGSRDPIKITRGPRPNAGELRLHCAHGEPERVTAQPAAAPTVRAPVPAPPAAPAGGPSCGCDWSAD